MKETFNKRQRCVSPLIATILLIVVAVILVTILLTWEKNFFGTNLSNDADVSSI